MSQTILGIVLVVLGVIAIAAGIGGGIVVDGEGSPEKSS